MDKNGWNVGEAKQQFSEVLRRSETEPQLIYHRSRLVAAVVAVNETSVGAVARRVTIADRIREASALFRQENYKLPATRRRARPNSFAVTLNALASRHERSK
jgi:antitoxin (DNA-binding transcriptional repressor) of toxin-antitoxin stability system